MNKKIFKNIVLLIIILIVGSILFASCAKKKANKDNANIETDANGNPIPPTTEPPKKGKIGLCFDNLDDANTNKYANSIKNELEKANYIVLLSDAKGNQDTQDEQIDNCISEECNVFVIALCDINNAAFIVDKSVQSGIPIIFVKNEIAKETLNINPRDVYVGSKNKVLNDKNDPKIILKAIEDLMAGKSYSANEQLIYTK